MKHPALAIGTLALLGLLAAAGIGLLVNAVSGDSIGLAAEPLSAEDLAPPEAENEGGEHRDRHQDRDRDRNRDRGDDAAPADDDGGVVTEPGDDNGGVVIEPGDDNGGELEPGD